MCEFLSSILHKAPPFCHNSSPPSVLPDFFLFLRLGGASSSVYHCEPTWSRDFLSEQDNDPTTSFDSVHVDPPIITSPGYQDGLASHPTSSRPCPHSMACPAPYHSTPSPGVSPFPYRCESHTQYLESHLSTTRSVQRLLPSPFLSTGRGDANRSLQRSPAELQPPIDPAIQPSRHLLQRSRPPGTHPSFEPASILPEDSASSPPNLDYGPAQDRSLTARSTSPCPARSSGRPDLPPRQRGLHRSFGSRELRRWAGWPPNGPPNFPQAANKFQSYRPTGSPDDESIYHEQPSTPPRKPKSWMEASSNEESVEEAQMTTVTSPSKPRLVTISPRAQSSRKLSLQPITPLSTPQAPVSAFSPDTPPETPDVADPSDEDAGPTCQHVMEQRLASLDTKISYPFTPPNSRIPTPFDDFDKITRSASACLQDRSCWVPPTMTQLDPSTAWILQELEVLLADFPMTALRIHSPVIKRLRAATSGVSIAGTSARHPSSTAAHSRYSPYRPLSSHPMSPQSLPQRDESPRATYPSPVPQAEPTSIALRTVFPQARPHHVDSLQATYLALQFIVNLPSSDFAVASASDAAASPFTTSIKHSRSSSIVSNIPPKARAMLGLDSPVRSLTPLASPAVSWYRASSPELDSDVKARLENVELLLETSVRKILVEMEGRPLGKADDALVRAVGEVIKMGERRNGATRS